MMQIGYSNLTKPQARYLAKAMKGGGSVPVYGVYYGVAGRLELAGLGDVCGENFYVNRRGLEVLRDYRSALYAKNGSMAQLIDLERVEAALAEAA